MKSKAESIAVDGLSSKNTDIQTSLNYPSPDNEEPATGGQNKMTTTSLILFEEVNQKLEAWLSQTMSVCPFSYGKYCAIFTGRYHILWRCGIPLGDQDFHVNNQKTCDPDDRR